MYTLPYHSRVPRRIDRDTLENHQNIHSQTTANNKAANSTKGNLEPGVWENSTIQKQDGQLDCCDGSVI